MRRRCAFERARRFACALARGWRWRSCVDAWVALAVVRSSARAAGARCASKKTAHGIFELRSK
ncbi:hypothetical protein HMPREF1868_00587 [Olsenella sp. DNF00959]|nr:hypothetical protein HMPREF1868_00587 [Olsenella sp. DNF00959]